MARWNVTRESDKDTYVLDDSSLPEGCAHSGVNRVVNWKVEAGFRLEQQSCEHLANGNTFDAIKASQEAGNEVVEV